MYLPFIDVRLKGLCLYLSFGLWVGGKFPLLILGSELSGTAFHIQGTSRLGCQFQQG